MVTINKLNLNNDDFKILRQSDGWLNCKICTYTYQHGLCTLHTIIAPRVLFLANKAKVQPGNNNLCICTYSLIYQQGITFTFLTSHFWNLYTTQGFQKVTRWLSKVTKKLILALLYLIMYSTE